MRFIGIITLYMILSFTLYAQDKHESSLIKIDEKGKITYIPDEKGNILPDFSRVGYHHCNKPIPEYKVTKTLYAPTNGSAQELIQQAIDEIAQLKPDKNGHRGTILLKAGVYKIPGNIRIAHSGIVLKGEGDNENGTKLIATGKEQRPLISINGKGKRTEIEGTRVKITDDFIPVGTHSFNVSSTKNFKVGDKIILFRPGTEQWIKDLQMDKIAPRQGLRQWQPQEYNLYFEREITSIKGNTIYIDNPVMMEMENKYGGGEIYKYTFEGRISEIGIENMLLESEYESDTDEAHSWNGIQVNNAENCWIRNITTKYFAYAAVNLNYTAKNITVLDCSCLDAKSVITGGRRYSFNNNGQQNLFVNCTTTEGRHDYVTGAQVCGPNVFYNCSSTRTHGDTGPHHRWAVGTLYDNINTTGEINVQDRGNWGTGHGWAGVTQILWNCTVRSACVQNPWASGKNYAIGLKGRKGKGRLEGRPDGVWENHNEEIIPTSLFMTQLKARSKKVYIP